MSLFTAWLFLSVFLSSDKRDAFRALDPRLPLIYFPLSIGLIQIRKEIFIKAVTGIAIITTFFSLVCLTYGIYRSLTLHSSAYLYNDSLSFPITDQQSIYISILVNISIYIFTWLIFYNPTAKLKGLMIIAIMFLFVISFLLASRNMMLVLYISTIGFALYFVFKRKKYLEGATLILGLFIGIFVVYKLFPKTFNRFKEIEYTKFDYQQTGPESHYNMDLSADQWNGFNTRLAIWQCGWELFKQSPIIGVHLGEKQSKLMDIYRSKNFEMAIRTKKTMHNNYLDILAGLGVIGLLIFLVSWLILPIRIFWKKREGLALLIILTFAIGMITDVYFDRSLGGMLFGFFIPFLLSYQNNKEKATTDYPPGTS